MAPKVATPAVKKPSGPKEHKLYPADDVKKALKRKITRNPTKLRFVAFEQNVLYSKWYCFCAFEGDIEGKNVEQKDKRFLFVFLCARISICYVLLV